jgi:hypothetical protein
VDSNDCAQVSGEQKHYFHLFTRCPTRLVKTMFFTLPPLHCTVIYIIIWLSLLVLFVWIPFTAKPVGEDHIFSVKTRSVAEQSASTKELSKAIFREVLIPIGRTELSRSPMDLIQAWCSFSSRLSSISSSWGTSTLNHKGSTNLGINDGNNGVEAPSENVILILFQNSNVCLLFTFSHLFTELLSTPKITQPLIVVSTAHPIIMKLSLPFRYATGYYTLLYAILRYSTLLYATLHYSTLFYATLRYSTLLYATLRYSTLLYSTLRYSTLLYATLLYATDSNL